MRNRNGKIIVTVFVSLWSFLLLFQAAEIRGEQYEGETDFIMVGVEEAKTLLEEGAVFVDDRTAEEYQKLHVEGAVRISVEDLDKDLLWIIFTNSDLWEGCGCEGTLRKKDLAEIDSVVYGSGADDENVAAVAGKLLQIGFRNLFVMRDGFEKWSAAGYYTETGKH